jgi:putative hydrolase
MTPEQRAVLERVQALMSLLEGHATFIMDRVGDGRVRDAARMRRSLQERRQASGIERTFQRVIGFDTKIRQYDVGERFVAQVVDGAGIEGFNRVWDSPDNLPSMPEVMKPADWLARVVSSGGSGG